LCWQQWVLEEWKAARFSNPDTPSSTYVPGSRDIIEDGVSGLLVPPSDPQALAGAIRRLAESPGLHHQMGEQARRRVEQHFTIEHEVAAHERLYSRLLGLPS